MFCYKNPQGLHQQFFNFVIHIIIRIMYYIGIYPFKHNSSTGTIQFVKGLSRIRCTITQVILSGSVFTLYPLLLNPIFPSALNTLKEEYYIKFLGYVQFLGFTAIAFHIFILFLIFSGTVLKLLNSFILLKNFVNTWKTNPKLDEEFSKTFIKHVLFTMVMLLVCYRIFLIHTYKNAGLVAVFGFMYQTFSFSTVFLIFHGAYLYLAHCMKVVNVRLEHSMNKISKFENSDGKTFKKVELTNICCDLSDEIDALAAFQMVIHYMKDDLMGIFQWSLAPCLLSIFVLHVVQLVEIFRSYEAIFGMDSQIKLLLLLGIVILILQECQLYYIVSGPEKLLKRVRFCEQLLN